MITVLPSSTSCCDRAKRRRNGEGQIVDWDNFSMQPEQSPKEPVGPFDCDFPFEPVQLPSPDQSICDTGPTGPALVSTPGTTGAESPGQHDVDRKAFKGRGGRRRFAAAKAAVDTVHDDMRMLAAATKSIKAKRLYLAIHVRSATGQMSLRWRRAGTTNTSHIAWHALGEMLTPLPLELVQWYRRVNALAIALNGDEKHARAVLRHLEEVMQQKTIQTG